MKKLKKIKLNEFSKAELDRRAKNALRGGTHECNCRLFLRESYWDTNVY